MVVVGGGGGGGGHEMRMVMAMTMWLAGMVLIRLESLESAIREGAKP